MDNAQLMNILPLTSNEYGSSKYAALTLILWGN